MIVWAALYASATATFQRLTGAASRIVMGEGSVVVCDGPAHRSRMPAHDVSSPQKSRRAHLQSTSTAGISAGHGT